MSAPPSPGGVLEHSAGNVARYPDVCRSAERIIRQRVGVKAALEGSLFVYALMAPGTEGKMDQKTRFLNDDVSEIIIFCRRNNPVILQGRKQEGGQRTGVGLGGGADLAAGGNAPDDLL